MDNLLPEPFMGVPSALFTHYGLVVDNFTPLDGEYDSNFHIHTRKGGEFVFKVMHSSRTPEYVDFQVKTLSYVATASPHLSIPRAVPSLSGALFVTLITDESSSPTTPPTPRLACLLHWLPGLPYALTQPHSPPLLEALGRVMGGLTGALQGFSHPAAHRQGFKWDLAGAGWIVSELGAVASPHRRAIIENIMGVLYASIPWEGLRRSLIHGDANDHNILVDFECDSSSPSSHPRLSVLDFGDAYHAPTVCELATMAAYAALGHRHPLEAIASVAAGYNSAFPLTPLEWRVLFPLTLARLCVSVVNSALRVALLPPGSDASYILISEAPAWQALERLHAIPPSVACARLRCAAGVLGGHGIVGAASVEGVEGQLHTSPPHPLLLGISGAVRLDFSPASPLINTQLLQARLATSGGTTGTPGWDALMEAVVEEVSRRGGLGVTLPGDCVFASPAQSILFGGGGGGGGVYHPSPPPLLPGEPWECAELGTTVYSTRMFEGGGVEMLYAPASGTIVEVSMGSQCVVVEHTAGAATVAAAAAGMVQGGGDLHYYSVYTGCDVAALPYLLAQQVVVGGHIGKGEPLGCMATHKVKGGGLLGVCHVLLLCMRPEHPPFSSSSSSSPSPSSGFSLPPLFISCLPGLGPKFWWRTLAPPCSPFFCGLSPSSLAATNTNAASLLTRRKALMGGNVRLSYRGSEGGPLHVVRGKGSWLWSGEGTPYLDCYNNVPVVGHCHPALLAAAAGQSALLNTNTRYLHEGVLEYGEALTALLPPSLSVCFFLNSASEANECALRLARAATGGRQDIIVLDHAYHGNTNTLVDISPYKFAGKGGGGKKPWVHVAPCPDTFRGPLSHLPPHTQGPLYAASGVGAMVRGGGPVPAPAAFIAESMPSVAGQLFFPPGFLAGVYEVVRGAGGVCIADEVQTGFGRMGECMWGFEHQGVVPDIVVLGKPAGGGFPLGVVVTTPAIAHAFNNGMEFFSTFGGNPVAARVGLAVLKVLQEEGLQANARDTGAWLKGKLEALMPHYPIIGDVRGMGLYLGVECVSDRVEGGKTPATAQTEYIVNRLKERGVLVGTEGPYNSVIKIRPPLCFNREEAGVFVRVFKEVLGEVGAGVGKKVEEKVEGGAWRPPTPLALTAGLLVAWWGVGKVMKLLADRK